MKWWLDRRLRRRIERQMQAEQEQARNVIRQALWLVGEINRLADMIEEFRMTQRGGRSDA
jgi:uridine kinase